MTARKKLPKSKDIHLHLEYEPELLRWLIAKASASDRSLTAEARFQLKQRYEADRP